jgi:hypothetical protein
MREGLDCARHTMQNDKAEAVDALISLMDGRFRSERDR